VTSLQEPLREITGDLESRWYDLSGFRVHVRVSNESVPDDAPTVVLVHGMVVSSLYMVPIAERLAPFCHVYVPDLPGYGDSDKPHRTLKLSELTDALVAWMRAADIEQAAFLGNSLGCQIIVDLAIRYPHRVESLILQGPTTDPRGRTAWQQIARLLADAPLEPPSHGLNVARDYLKAGPRRSAVTFKVMLADPIEKRLPYVQAPALVVRGSNDPIVPENWAEDVAKLMPKGELRVVPGGSHTLTYAAPLELARISLPFIRKHHAIRHQEV
jgi:2-hydroxy-6-oxonona-2,4-dienedioate hydrolase